MLDCDDGRLLGHFHEGGADYEARDVTEIAASGTRRFTQSTTRCTSSALRSAPRPARRRHVRGLQTICDGLVIKAGKSRADSALAGEGDRPRALRRDCDCRTIGAPTEGERAKQ